MVINTVTYSRDIYLMLLQAHSIEKFIDVPITHHVYVQDDRIPIPIWEKALSPIYKKHTLVLSHNKFKIHEPQQRPHGWNEQQYIKLMLASEMQHEYILSLDSKNIFFKPVDIEKTFYGHEGGLGNDIDVHTSNLEWVKYWSIWIKMVEDRTGIKSPKQRFPCTPFVFKNSSLKKMNKNLDVRHLFQSVFNTEIRPSEYILYNFFKDQKSFSLEKNLEDFGIYTVYRRDLDDIPEYKEKTRALLLGVGLEPNYVNPAIDRTSQRNR